jgi:hypothetical protein
MASLHLIERLNNVRKLVDAPPFWESGYWAIPVETAERLIGGDLYLHSGQLEPSHFGGKIVGYRVHNDGTDIDGRIVFRIAPNPTYKGVKTERAGWGNEKKFVW